MSNLTIGSKQEGYLLEFESDAVYLTAYPPEENGSPFSDVTLVCALLKKHEAPDFKVTDVIKILREHSGERIELAAGEKAEELPLPLPGLTISRDKMEVTLSFEKLPENIDELDRKMIDDLLAQNKVVYGIMPDEIEQFLTCPSLSRTVARGKAQVNGQDAYIKQHIDFSRRNHPSELEYGRVDFKNLNLFFTVSKGDLLAERILQTKGTEGTNVFGQVVSPKPGKPIPLIKGKNTAIIDDNKLIAVIDGQAVEDGKTISVDPKLELEGSVDLSTGNINFNGMVIVNGNVADGFYVKTDGDVKVNGTVSGTIEARNVYISGGILGARNGSVRAKEDIYVSFIENGDVIAHRDIFVNDVVLHSKINAGRNIIAIKGKGQIVGGTATAGLLLDVKFLGNPANVITRAIVGENPVIKSKYDVLKEKILREKQELEKISSALQMLNKNHLPDLEKKAIQLKKMQFSLAGQIEREEKEKKQLEDEIDKLSRARIRVSDIVFAGVRIVVQPYFYTVQNRFQHTSFIADTASEMVKIAPY